MLVPSKPCCQKVFSTPAEHRQDQTLCFSCRHIKPFGLIWQDCSNYRFRCWDGVARPRPISNRRSRVNSWNSGRRCVIASAACASQKSRFTLTSDKNFGNTGHNLFDEAQPDFFTAALITKGNFDDGHSKAALKLTASLGVDSLHGKELGVERIEKIADDLLVLLSKAQACVEDDAGDANRSADVVSTPIFLPSVATNSFFIYFFNS